jgi:ATP-dependent DNA helicase RecG
LGGGYIIIGIEEENGIPKLPITGLHRNEIDKIQKELISLTNTIDPFYAPVTEPLEYKEKLIFIMWVPGGQNRPYKAPTTLSAKGQKQYFIRRGSTTVIANHAEIKQLMEMAASIPFDDRINHQTSLADLELGLIREFLQEIKSDLFDQSVNMPFGELCKQMLVASGPNEYLKPINVGLLFFNNRPEKHFRGAITEIVLFDDDTGTEFKEQIIKGSIYHQIKTTLEFIKSNILLEKIVKIPGRAEAKRFYNWPYEALEEVVVNAFYHRSYDHQNSVEINIHPDKIEILSFPGPLPPVNNESLQAKRVVSRDYRNRRIGDFLKELGLTEGRGTGLPKIHKEMEKNGSPSPIFETDAERTSFLVVLPVHPDFLSPTNVDGILSLRNVVQDETFHTLLFCYSPRTRKEILERMGIGNYYKNYKSHIFPLIQLEYLALTIPEKPNSRLQRYYTTVKGKRLLADDRDN